MRTLLLFFRSLPRLFKNAGKDMSRHLPMTLSSILSVGIALLLAMVMLMVSFNVVHFANIIEQDIQVQVSLSPTLSAEEIDELKGRIEQLEDVGEVIYSSKEEELASLIAENGETFSQYQESNPLYDVFVINLDNPNSIDTLSEEVAGMDGILEINNGGDTVFRIVEIFDSFGVVAWTIIIGLSLLGIFLIRNTISLAITVRKDEIFIMRHVGAYDFYISMPFILQGLIIGFYGSLFPIVICDLFYEMIYHIFSGRLITQTFSLYNPIPFLVYISVAIFLTGLILGTFGSWLAVRKYIKSTR